MPRNLIDSRLGKYEIKAEIGKGGMGIVYLGYDPLLDRQVAIKVLAPHLVWEEGFVERFLREARAAARIKHPNIVTIHDVGQEGDQFYFVMEYLAGQTLAEHIRERGPLPPSEVESILRPVADAVDYAHQHGLVHRDIKPGNIVIDPTGQVTLTDFGIARAAQETRLTTAGTIMGTPEYMSPEQAWGEEVDYHTDLYSLAVVAYEMLSGRVPFRGTTPHAVLYKQIHEPPPPIQEERPELPASVDVVLGKALSKEPSKRYTTVTAFVDELGQALQGKVITPPEEAPTQAMAPAEVPPAEVPPVPDQPTSPAAIPAPGQVPKAKPAPSRRLLPRWLWALGGLAILLLAAGLVWLGLGGGGGFTPTPSPQATHRPTATLTPRPEATRRPEATPTPHPTPARAEHECTDPAGCVRIEGDEPILIGYMLLLSGPNEALGIVARNGLEMAVENRQQILGHPIELHGEDSECNPDGGQRAATVFASGPKVVAVVGPTCSDAAYGAIPVMCEANIPLISPSATGPELTTKDRPPHFRCFLRTAFTDAVLGEDAARFAASMGIGRAATIHDGSPFSEVLQRAFSREFEERGGVITAQEPIPPDGPDLPSAVTSIAATGPELIYFPVNFELGVHVTNIVRENPELRDIMLMGADGMFTPAYLAVAGERAVGTLLVSPDVTALDPGYPEFLRRYEERYGGLPPNPYHRLAYDAATMIFSAIERVAVREDDGTLIIGRLALLEALYATRGLRGMSGIVTCNQYGDCASPATAVYEIVNGDPDSWNPGEGPQSNPRKIWP
jgi:branched-chain amino acid transport system substrate-binding protein